MGQGHGRSQLLRNNGQKDREVQRVEEPGQNELAQEDGQSAGSGSKAPREKAKFRQEKSPVALRSETLNLPIKLTVPWFCCNLSVPLPESVHSLIKCC